MGKATRWLGEVDGETYIFVHHRTWFKHILTVDGTPVETKSHFSQTPKDYFRASSIFGIDEPFMLGGKKARFVFSRNKPDVVVDAIYLRSGKPYVTHPGWVWWFVILCLLILPLLGFGLIPALFAFGGAERCVHMSKSSLSTTSRVVRCIFITLAAWLLTFIALIQFFQITHILFS